LAKLLQYSDWRNFIAVINKSMEDCENSGDPIKNHFVEITDMVSIGSGAQRQLDIYCLSRYACNLIIQMLTRLKK